MRPRLLAGLSVGVVLLLAGCGVFDDDPSLDGTWAVVEIDGQPIVVGENTVTPPYLEIGDGTIGGSLGCNHGGGELVEVGPAGFVVGDVAQELQLCIPDAVMFAEWAIADVLEAGSVGWSFRDDHLVLVAAGRQLVLESVPTAPTLPPPEPVETSTWGPLDCSPDLVVEDLRVDGDGITPLELAQRYEAGVVEVRETEPLWWHGLDADGVLRVLVLGHDDGTGDFQVLSCGSG